MNRLLKFFSYKKVATILIQCALPFEGTVVTFTQKCKLYENKNRERKINMPLDYYPLVSIRNRALVERFINGQCTPDIPTYQQIKHGTLPVVLEDVASFYF